MSNSLSRQRFVLFILFLVTLGWVYLLYDRSFSTLLAAESPLVQPWPTLVVHYPPSLDGVITDPAVQSQAVRVTFHSALRLPSPPPHC